MIQRHVTAGLLEALSDTRVVLLHGARQTGKSTLVQSIAAGHYGPKARYMTLDDAGVLAAARDDPVGFVTGLELPVALDEVQRVPELFLAIKSRVDRDRRPGQFLLTGSANVMLLPHLSESLAGRMEVLSLWPLSQGEIEGVQEGFVDALFDEPLPQAVEAERGRASIVQRILRGGVSRSVVTND